MPFNLPGTLVPFYALFSPRLLLPAVSVAGDADIRQLDFAALRRAGYRGAVFDKDNCLTIPHDDTLVPKLRDAWQDCRETFGPDNVLIVSNSAGTYLDPGALQAESVRHKLGVPVLFHPTLKPSYGCARSILSYFSSLPSPLAPHELVFIGDRIFTDVVLAHRLGEPPSVWQRMLRRLRLARLPKSNQPAQITDGECSSASVGGDMKVLRAGVEPLAVWTTGMWKREGMGMRWAEQQVVKAVEHWMPDAAMERRNLEAQFTKPMVETKPENIPKSRGSWILGGLGWMVSKIRPRKSD